MFVLSANGDMISIDHDDADSVINLENAADDTEFRCSVCGIPVYDTSGGYVDERGEWACEASEPVGDPDVDDAAAEVVRGPHRPQRVPLAWVNGAAIRTEPEQGSVTVSINVGDPRGAFTFSVRRVPDDAPANAGRLVMHVPHPDEPLQHAPLIPAHPGTYWVG
ncbi:hypothetical protein [Saccharopolyspora sp. SCSIO 74807]|uniref:hypothetical protein n=1 Tax=Saccharopolyspora sp. SCSIO 74807 TaxID=3118084 RepID=UPI0030D3F657